MPVPLEKMLEEFTPEERARIDRNAADIVAQNRTLAQLRKSLNLTQAELAKALKTTQANVAQIEGKKDVMVSTLARMVKAMGGSLQLTVNVPGHEPVALKIGTAKGEPAIKPVRKRRYGTRVITGSAHAGGQSRRRA
jgi:transcriptional regulator with XRE-family HTH domain